MECFWLRGLLPSHLVQVSPPSQEEHWQASGEFLLTGAFGHGSRDAPIFLFGDASVGAHKASPRGRFGCLYQFFRTSRDRQLDVWRACRRTAVSFSRRTSGPSLGR
eukprot:8962196-Pyramimonas_sp.AAC.1